jgi:hypothetical protein
MLLELPLAPGPSHRPGLRVERVHVRVIVTPGVAEVIFGAGAKCAGKALAVHVDLLVAFAPPSGRGVEDIQEQAHETARRTRHTERGLVLRGER